MMQAREESTGVTYGALIAFTLAVVATLALTGGAGYYLGKSLNSAPEAVVTTTTTNPATSATIFDLKGGSADATVQQAATSPFVLAG